MARKWLEGAVVVLRQETLTQPFTKRTVKRADELISDSLSVWRQAQKALCRSICDNSIAVKFYRKQKGNEDEQFFMERKRKTKAVDYCWHKTGNYPSGCGD